MKFQWMYLLLWIFISLPLSLYVRYSILQAIHADRLLMFLFWIDLPVNILLAIFSAMAKGKEC